jgi:hypothetical protein
MVFGDSTLVIRQVNKDWDCTSEKMDAYFAQIRKLENKSYGLEFHHMLWDDNQAADKLDVKFLELWIFLGVGGIIELWL